MKALSIHCDHHHDDRCPRCEDLKSTLKEIEEALTNETLLSQDERDDLLYSFRIAKEAIAAWKAHQLRSFQQDQARTDVLDSLDESSVLITQDWAMKWLPQRYRETQADWFWETRHIVAHQRCRAEGGWRSSTADVCPHCRRLQSGRRQCSAAAAANVEGLKERAP